MPDEEHRRPDREDEAPQGKPDEQPKASEDEQWDDGPAWLEYARRAANRPREHSFLATLGKVILGIVGGIALLLAVVFGLFMAACGGWCQ